MQDPDDDFDLSISDVFEDDEVVEEFMAELDAKGIVVSIHEDGVLMALSSEKIEELAKIANSNPERKIIIFIDSSVGKKKELQAPTTLQN